MMEVEELQKEIWGVEDREVLPALAMIPMRKVGGLLLGAFDGGRMIGFAFAFPGIEGGRPILHSDMLAVKPAYRSQGLGKQLKLAQRIHALEQGIDTITWTFDPLQSLNARLNFGKLGVFADRYYPDFYGATTSFLHSTGTDRLWVTWLLNSERVKARLRGDDERGLVPDDVPAIVTLNDSQEPIESEEIAGSVFLDIPADINGLVKSNIELGRRWREATRNAFTRVLAKGFRVEDFYLSERNGMRFGRYLLCSQA